MNKNIDYLIISSTIDYSTDLVCYRLLCENKIFYRLNRDEFKKHEISCDLQTRKLEIRIENEIYIAEFEKLKGIYFRAPVFLRTQTNKKTLDVEEQLERNQWSSFLRNLIVFENAIWINNPVNTYKAENKMFQLYLAEKLGLNIPKTFVTNSNSIHLQDENNYVIKSLDTALFFDTKNNQEMFTYTNALKGVDIKQSNLSDAPVFVQEYLSHKIDCRITYVMGQIFSVKILKDGIGVYGDWRLQKDLIEYVPFVLPSQEEQKIKKLMEALNLNFGGIDLVIMNNDYYFIEVNPTGEWAWLEINAGFGISTAIAKALCQGE